MVRRIWDHTATKWRVEKSKKKKKNRKEKRNKTKSHNNFFLSSRNDSSKKNVSLCFALDEMLLVFNDVKRCFNSNGVVRVEWVQKFAYWWAGFQLKSRDRGRSRLIGSPVAAGGESVAPPLSHVGFDDLWPPAPWARLSFKPLPMNCSWLQLSSVNDISVNIETGVKLSNHREHRFDLISGHNAEVIDALPALITLKFDAGNKKKKNKTKQSQEEVESTCNKPQTVGNATALRLVYAN